LDGAERDLKRFNLHVKKTGPEERALIPDASLREFLSARIAHGDEDAVMNVVGSHPELLNFLSNTGLSPLIEALEESDTSLLTELLSAGADPNLPNAEGNTPLMMAVLNHGAQSDVGNPYSALELSVLDNDAEMLALLLQDGLGYSIAGLNKAALLARTSGNHVLLGLLLKAQFRTT
jgi:ankyrin repeat protein